MLYPTKLHISRPGRDSLAKSVTPPRPLLKRPHWQLIRLWALGCHVDGRPPEGQEWIHLDHPSFLPHWSYRIELPHETLISYYDGTFVDIPHRIPNLKENDYGPTTPDNKVDFAQCELARTAGGEACAGAIQRAGDESPPRGLQGVLHQPGAGILRPEGGAS